MNLDALLCAAQILRSEPSGTLALKRLHARLVDELGDVAGTCDHVYAALKKRPQCFNVVEAPKLVDDPAYDALLEGAGLSACTWITLAETSAPDFEDPLAMAGATLSELWSRTESDPALREYLVHAARQLESLGQALDPRASIPTQSR